MTTTVDTETCLIWGRGLSYRGEHVAMPLNELVELINNAKHMLVVVPMVTGGNKAINKVKITTITVVTESDTVAQPKAETGRKRGWLRR